MSYIQFVKKQVFSTPKKVDVFVYRNIQCYIQLRTQIKLKELFTIVVNRRHINYGGGGGGGNTNHSFHALKWLIHGNSDRTICNQALRKQSTRH